MDEREQGYTDDDDVEMVDLDEDRLTFLIWQLVLSCGNISRSCHFHIRMLLMGVCMSRIFRGAFMC